ncbi:hypothetical protein PR048_023330 [Dryococelus australis]|uniref:Uncharacterized protein n=1 Tax=Dryococelus australis TaxID=614101 RepID=A0ABQ9GTR7_9NEOP|nr:hypothetical protein PR048_023330 [Dryococelus australis]
MTSRQPSTAAASASTPVRVDSLEEAAGQVGALCLADLNLPSPSRSHHPPAIRHVSVLGPSEHVRSASSAEMFQNVNEMRTEVSCAGGIEYHGPENNGASWEELRLAVWRIAEFQNGIKRLQQDYKFAQLRYRNCRIFLLVYERMRWDKSYVLKTAMSAIMRYVNTEAELQTWCKQGCLYVCSPRDTAPIASARSQPRGPKGERLPTSSSSSFYTPPITLGPLWLSGQPARLPLKPNRVQSPAGSLWGSCRTMPLVGGFSRGSLVSPPPFHSGAAPYPPQSPSSAVNTSPPKSLHSLILKISVVAYPFAERVRETLEVYLSSDSLQRASKIPCRMGNVVNYQTLIGERLCAMLLASDIILLLRAAGVRGRRGHFSSAFLSILRRSARVQSQCVRWRKEGWPDSCYGSDRCATQMRCPPVSTPTGDLRNSRVGRVAYAPWRGTLCDERCTNAHPGCLLPVS